MRTTLNLDDELIAEAAKLSGIGEKTELIHEALRALLAREAGRRLIALGGTMPDGWTPQRRRLEDLLAPHRDLNKGSR